jgi:DNA-binding transcriptional ArsR family regulator
MAQSVDDRPPAGEASVAELAEPFSMSQPAISKHLKVLERAGLISSGRDAQKRPRALVAKPLADASHWLDDYRRFWEEKLDGFEALLQDMQDTNVSDRTRGRTKR